MNIQTNLIFRQNFRSQFPETINVSHKSENKPPVIFIEKSQTTFSSNYENKKFKVKGFSEAKRILFAAEEHSYKIIVIDIALSIAELEEFSSIVRSKPNTIIIYNSTKLTKNEAKFLKAFLLVDEVIDSELHDIDLVVKSVIERKSKNKYERIFNKTKQLQVNGKIKVKDLSFFLKKVFDISIAAILILLLLPLLVLICFAISYDLKGPVFYSSLRAGRGYKIFKFYKFRTMIVDADKKIAELAHLNQYNLSDNGPTFFKLNDDPRVTRVGKFLRNSSLDELPQLFNILLGDMSLVGNRPLPLYEAATLTTNDFVERFTAPAGMTGFWQIKKRGKAEMSVKERVDLDIIYARKASPIFDLYIMASTPKALFQKSDV